MQYDFTERMNNYYNRQDALIEIIPAIDLLSGPGNWSKEFIGCSNSDHRFQSPINIVLEQTHFDDTREKITFTTKHTAEKSNSLLLNDAKTGIIRQTYLYTSIKGFA